MKKIFLTTIFGFGLVMNAMAEPIEITESSVEKLTTSSFTGNDSETFKQLKEIFYNVAYNAGYADKKYENSANTTYKGYYEKFHKDAKIAQAIIKQYKNELVAIKDESGTDETRKKLIDNLTILFNQRYLPWGAMHHNYAWKSLRDNGYLKGISDGTNALTLKPNTIGNTVRLEYLGATTSEPLAKSLEKDEELVQQLVAKYSRSLGPTSPDTRVIHVRRAIMRDTHNNKDITERCMDMILKSVNWKKRH